MHEPGVQRFAGYDAVRIVLGLVLLTAAALKGYQLATEPVAETSLLTSRWFLIGVVEFEFVFGIWLLAGLYTRGTWRIALLCFSGFACVTLYKAFSGDASCGCFGKVPVNPWYTLVLDIAAMASLLRWRPAICATEGAWDVPFSVFCFGCVLAVSLIAGVPAALIMAAQSTAYVTGTGSIVGDSDFVVVEPEAWVGNMFPLLNYIDIGEQLSSGKWILVMYHHDCPECEAALPRYTQLSHDLRVGSDPTRVALVEVPPYGRLNEGVISKDSRCLLGHLDASKEWLVATPVEVVLEQGKTIRVTSQGS